MILKYEPFPELLHISAKQLFLHSRANAGGCACDTASLKAKRHTLMRSGEPSSAAANPKAQRRKQAGVRAVAARLPTP